MTNRFQERGPEFVEVRRHPALGQAERKRQGTANAVATVVLTALITAMCLFGCLFVAGVVGRIFWEIVSSGWHVWDLAR